MADFTERLIFRMEVDASDFQSKLRGAVTAATKGLKPRLNFRASDVKFTGRIKAERLFDMASLAASIKAAIQQGVGDVLTPTRPSGLVDPRGRPLAAEAKPTVPAIDVKSIQAIAAARQTDLSTLQQINALSRQVLATEIARGRAGIARVNAALQEAAALDRLRRFQTPRVDRALGRVPSDLERRRGAPGGIARQARRELEEQIARVKFIPDDSSIRRLITSTRSQIRRARFNFRVGLRLVGAETIRTTLDRFGSLGRVATASLFSVGRAARFLGGQVGAVSQAFASLGGRIRRAAARARAAIRPFTRLAGTIGRSVAVLTGSGLIIGGAAFLPVAAIRGATSAFRRLAEFVDGTTQSITLFSDKLARLEGAERVAFVDRQFKSLSSTIQDVAANFGLATSDVAKGLFSILSAQVGVQSVSERLEALEASARVAVGGVTDLESAFKGVIAISRTFGQSFEAAADQLFAIQRLGIAPINRLSTQLGRVASIAANAGARSEELGAAISTITAQAVPLETTITGLRQFFGVIAKGGSRAVQQELARIRSQFNIPITLDVNTIRRVGGLQEFLQQLAKLRQIDPSIISRLFPQTRVIAALLPLLDNLNQFSKDRIQILQSEGEADAAATARLNTIAGAFNKLSTAVSNTIVTVADQVAKFINLADIVKSTTERLNDFVNQVRSIPIDQIRELFQEFREGPGFRQLAERLSRAIFSALDAVAQVSAPIIRAFAGIAEVIRRLITSAIQQGIAAGLKGIGKVFGGIAKRIDRSGIARVFLQNFADISETIRASATEASIELSQGAESIGDAIQGGFDFSKNLGVGRFVDSLSAGLKGAGEEFGASILGKLDPLEDRLKRLQLSVDASRIRDATSEIGRVLDREVSFGGFQNLGRGVSKSIERDLLTSRIPEIARSVIGAVGEIDPTTEEGVKKLVQAQTEAVQAAQASVRKFGRAAKSFQLARFKPPPVPDVDAAKRFADEGTKTVRQEREILALARSRIAETQKLIEATRRALAVSGGPQEDVRIKERIKSLEESRASFERSAQSSSNSLRKLTASFRGALSEFDLRALGVVDPGQTLLEQFKAVDAEIQKILDRIKAGEKISPERLEALRSVRTVLGISIRRFEPTFDDAALRENISTIAERASEDFRKFIEERFEAIPVPRAGGPLGVPLVVPTLFPTGQTTRAGRDQLRQALKARENQIKDFVKFLRDAGRTEEIPLFNNLIKQVEALLNAIGRIPEEMAKAADSGGNFDRITFFVADAAKAAEAFAQGLNRSLSDPTRKVNELADAVAKLSETLDRTGSAIERTLGEEDPGFIGPRRAIVTDARIQVFNTQPDTVDDVLKQEEESTASQQNRLPK